MYFNAVITPVVLGDSAGTIKQQRTGMKKLTKPQSRTDTDQLSPPRLTFSRPHTATSYSQPVSLSPVPQPRRRSSSITLFHPPSIKKKSMSFVSLFFNRNTQPSRSNAGSSFIDVEEKQTNPFKLSKPMIETGIPPSISSRSRTRRHSRSFSSSSYGYPKDDGSNDQKSLHSHSSFPVPFSFISPPTTMRRFEHASTRSNESCTTIPRTKSPSSAFRQGADGKGGHSATLPTIDVIDADAFYLDDDVCSAISSMCFADDPDEKPPNKGKGHKSRVASTATDTDSPMTRSDRDSFVLDISASNRISDEPGDITESEAQAREEEDIEQTRCPPYRTKDKLLHTLGELPQQHQQTHQRRHSCSTTSVSSAPSRWPTNGPPSAELSPVWSLPDIPVVSPLTTSTIIPSPTTQPPTSTKSPPTTTPSSNPDAFKRKRRSTLLVSGVDGLTALLRPLETFDTRRFSRPFRSSTFSSSSSTPLPPPLVLSVPPTPPARALVPQSHPSVPPGLDAHADSSGSFAEQKTLEVESEDKKGKSRACRNSVMTQDSTFSDLHRLPSSLIDDSVDSQSGSFNTAPSTPTLLSCASPSLSTSSASESSAQSPALSFASTACTLQIISGSTTPSPTVISTTTHPTSQTPPSLLPPPRSILSPLSLTPTASTGIEHILDPVDSPFDPAVSPIVFASSSDSDDHSFEHHGDLTDDDSVEIGGWESQDEIEPMPLLRKVGTGNVEAKRKQRTRENSGWGSVRVPLRKKRPGERSRQAIATGAIGAVPSHSRRETTNWIGEWNSDMHNVIQHLRTLR